MVGDGHSFHAIGNGFIVEFGNISGTIQQGELGMNMEVIKGMA
jgi:hypothetical protein